MKAIENSKIVSVVIAILVYQLTSEHRRTAPSTIKKIGKSGVDWRASAADKDHSPIEDSKPQNIHEAAIAILSIQHSITLVFLVLR